MAELMLINLFELVMVGTRVRRRYGTECYTVALCQPGAKRVLPALLHAVWRGLRPGH